MKTETQEAAGQKLFPAENQKGIENHKKAAKHYEVAAKHQEAGNYDKACASAIKAYGHHCTASEAQREVSKIHANFN
jgi:hypothetical protein